MLKDAFALDKDAMSPYRKCSERHLSWMKMCWRLLHLLVLFAS